MKDIARNIELASILQKKSVFLLGPRQTGKTTLMQDTIKADKYYNLLDTDALLRLSQRPARLREEIPQNAKLVVIDEIQKLPELLNEIQLLIDTRKINFLLTGSSARKLYRAGVNLLGGRARIKYMHPFSAYELGDKFNLEQALNTGLIPGIWFSDAKREDLAAYAGMYLREEIAAEALVRNVPAFSRFLAVAACTNACMLNYSNIANDAQAPVSTVREYYQILKDTLIGYELPAWKASVKRKPIGMAKFYFFDPGIVQFLQGRKQLSLETPEAGNAFETFIFHEIKTYCDYKSGGELAYWRSTSGFEVDFIYNNSVAIEVKAKRNISTQDLKGLRALREENKLKKYMLISLEKEPRLVDNIELIPWRMFIQRLWAGFLD